MTGSGAFQSAASLLRLIRFSHTLFALPWALAGLLLGARGWPGWWVLAWVLGAMVGARTAAMGFNRLVDRRLDASNPRTARRPSVTGEVSKASMVVLVLAGGGLFMGSAWALNPLCGALSGPTLVLLLGYSFMKRCSAWSHVILGLSLGLSPLGAFLAAAGAFQGLWQAAAALGLAVVAWTAGFDILYACQDLEHDRKLGLHSVPARLGLARALNLARICHALVPLFLLLAYDRGGLGLGYLISVLVVAALLVYEHRLVRPQDLSRLNRAFFNVNVSISFVVLSGVLADLIRGGLR